MRNYPNSTLIFSVVVLGPPSDRKSQLLEALREAADVDDPIEAMTLGSEGIAWRSIDLPLFKLGISNTHLRQAVLRIKVLDLPIDRLQLKLHLKTTEGVAFVAGTNDEGPEGNAECWRALVEVLDDPALGGRGVPLALLSGDSSDSSEVDQFWEPPRACFDLKVFRVLRADESISATGLPAIVHWLQSVCSTH